MAGFKMSEGMANAVAHIYAGLAKADKTLSEEEKNEKLVSKTLRYYSKNIYFVDGEENEIIKENLLKILNDTEYISYDSEKHLSEGLKGIEENKGELDNIRPLHDTMKGLGKLDELTITETRYIKEADNALKKILSG